MDEFDECGLPVHLYVNVNSNMQGPLNDDDPDVIAQMCWCEDNINCTVLPVVTYNMALQLELPLGGSASL